MNLNRTKARPNTWLPAAMVTAVLTCGWVGAAWGQASPSPPVTCTTFGSGASTLTIVVKLVNGVCKVDPYESGDVPFMYGFTGGWPMSWQVCNKCGQLVDVRISDSSPNKLEELLTNFDPGLQSSNDWESSNIPVGQWPRFNARTTTSSDVVGHINSYDIKVKFSTDGLSGWRGFDPQLQLDDGNGILVKKLHLLLALLVALLFSGIAFVVGRRLGIRS